MKKRALITGITGQDGAYLSKLLLEKNYEVFGFASRRVNQSFENLDYLGISSQVQIIFGDISDVSSINHALHVARPHEVYNLAAMSFVGLSWQEPIHTTQINALGPLYLLEAVKSICPDARVYQASTSEMFGNSNEHDLTQNELTPLRPRSPYGFAKVFAHNAIVNYRESYSMFACSGILFNHESPIRGKEFVTRKITDGVARINSDLQEYIELGNLDSKRDWGFAGDYVDAMWMMLQQGEPDDYVISTGKTWSIEELLSEAFSVIGISDWKPYVKQNPVFMRPAELFYLKGDPSKAKEKLGWEPKTTFKELIKIMVDADMDRYLNHQNEV
jgi:GDPmannose 4,6-dehydratase